MKIVKIFKKLPFDALTCTIHEMYAYDWGKLVIYLNITTSSTRSPGGKETSIISI